jgi:hypothetical protein
MASTEQAAIPGAAAFPLYHVHGPDACRGLAFYTTRRWQPGDLMTAADVRLPDGRAPQDGDLILCATCGVNVGTQSLDYDRASTTPPEWP